MVLQTKKTSSYLFSRGGGRSIAPILIGAVILVGILIKVTIFKKPITETATKEQASQALRGILTPEEINKLPDVIYREDIPSDTAKKLPPELINLVPSKYDIKKK